MKHFTTTIFITSVILAATTLDASFNAGTFIFHNAYAAETQTSSSSIQMTPPDPSLPVLSGQPAATKSKTLSLPMPMPSSHPAIGVEPAATSLPNLGNKPTLTPKEQPTNTPSPTPATTTPKATSVPPTNGTMMPATPVTPPVTGLGQGTKPAIKSTEAPVPAATSAAQTPILSTPQPAKSHSAKPSSRKTKHAPQPTKPVHVKKQPHPAASHTKHSKTKPHSAAKKKSTHPIKAINYGETPAMKHAPRMKHHSSRYGSQKTGFDTVPTPVEITGSGASQ